MSALTPPTVPQYRITFFFGPEPLEGDVRTVQCVFNVKKRSWKSGIQVAVLLRREFLATLRDCCGFDARLAAMLEPMGEEEEHEYRLRAEELLVIEMARLKLDVALGQGIPQENVILPIGGHEDRLPDLVRAESIAIMARIAAELDLPPA